MMDTLRVLFVEDSENDVELMTRELRRVCADLHLERVDDARAMHAALENAQWDVIICDWTMPAFSARAALESLEDHRAGCSVHHRVGHHRRGEGG